MNRRTFTKEQTKDLSRNKNVARCGDSSLRYNKTFRMEALRKYNQDGLSAVGIFQEAGFDLEIIGKRTPNRLMNQWNTALMPRPKTQARDEAVVARRVENRRNIKTLEAKVAYLEAENRFLARLRAGKRQ